MRYWVISDTHFGHKNIEEWCGRPNGYENMLLQNLAMLVQADDVLIHLGDVAFQEEKGFVKMLRRSVDGKMILVKGNHDRRSNGWYQRYGFDMVCDTLTLKRQGENVLFSHKPQDICQGFSLNVHGHFHNVEKSEWESDLVNVLTKRHLLIKCEHDYKPYLLDGLIKRHRKGL